MILTKNSAKKQIDPLLASGPSGYRAIPSMQFPG
jgi:hypothetical protein